MPRRSRSRIAASEWQAGPMVQMILARRGAGDARDEGKSSGLKELSAANSCLLDFTCSSTSCSGAKAESLPRVAARLKPCPDMNLIRRPGCESNLQTWNTESNVLFLVH